MQPDGAFLEGILEEAKKNLEKDDFLMPTLIMFCKEAVEFYAMSQEVWGPSSTDRYKTLYRLGSTMGYGMDAESIVIITDAYIKTKQLPKGTTREQAEELGHRHGSLKDDPEARDAILIMQLDHNLDSRMVSCAYDKHEVAGKSAYEWDVEEVHSTKDDPQTAAFAYSYRGFWDGVNKTNELTDKLLTFAPHIGGYSPEREQALRAQLKETCVTEGRKFLKEVSLDDGTTVEDHIDDILRKL